MEGRPPPGIVVVGTGNESSGDDGAGLRVARALLREPLPPYVSVYEAGMAGLRLIDLWMGCDLCIVVDAMDAGEPPGTIREFGGAQAALECLGGAGTGISSHGARLKEALELGAALGPPYIPGEVRVIGIQADAERVRFGTEGLSPEVEAACEEVVARIHEILANL